MVVKYPRCVALGDERAPKLISTLASLVYSQVISGTTHTAGHILDLIFDLDVKIEAIITQPPSWIDHHLIKTVVRDLPVPRQQERLMNSNEFQSLLKDNSIPSKDEELKAW